MIKRKKLWVGMNLVTAAGAVALVSCGVDNSTTQQPPVAQKPAFSAGADGEGEGLSASENPVTSDLAFLKQLALMRGHLFVGYSLYQQGHVAHAKTHMKHPKSELYSGLQPGLTSRNAPGFSSELEQLAMAVENEQDNATVTSAYNKLTAAIGKAEAAVNPESVNVSSKLLLAAALLRVAGEEYDIAVVDGRMENAHEYQDALGFTQVANNVLESAAPSNDDEKSAVVKAQQLTAKLQGHWPNIMPPETLTTNGTALYGAAARIELLGMGLR